jgi:threonine synthase
MPRDAPLNKQLLVKIFGGRLILGSDRGEANRLAIEDSIEGGVYYVGHVWNPFFIQGLKTIPYEIIEEGIEPDDIFIPVGSGGLYLGIYKGYMDLMKIRLIKKLPRLHTVESAGYERISRYVRGAYKYPNIKSELADGLRVPGPPRLGEIVEALQETGGETYVVNDEEIKREIIELHRRGLFVEPTSATAYAAYKTAQREERIPRDTVILIPLTGSGFKALDKVEEVHGFKP